MKDHSLRDRITSIVGHDAAEKVFQVLDEELATRCRDADCFRRWPHSKLSRHFWRHAPVPPHFRGLLGYCCFTCRRHTWRRVHRKSGSRA